MNENKRWDIVSVLGFALSVLGIPFMVVSLAGFILSIIGIVTFKPKKEKGRKFALAGLIISIAMLILRTIAVLKVFSLLPELFGEFWQTFN